MIINPPSASPPGSKSGTPGVSVKPPNSSATGRSAALYLIRFGPSGLGMHNCTIRLHCGVGIRPRSLGLRPYGQRRSGRAPRWDNAGSVHVARVPFIFGVTSGTCFDTSDPCRHWLVENSLASALSTLHCPSRASPCPTVLLRGTLLVPRFLSLTRTGGRDILLLV